MSEENGEYEVESVVAAKVDKEKRPRKRKNPKLVWSYRVRWKGYTPEEDTWEPAESFADSEQILDAFWSRVSTNLNGRDRDNLTLFQYGEEIYPLGPPTRKKMSTNLSKPGPSQPNKTLSESSPSAQLSKRHRSPDIEIIESPPLKKAREASIELISPPPRQAKGKAPMTPVATSSFVSPSHTRSQQRRLDQRPISPEIVPPSDGEMDEDTLTKSFASISKPTAPVIDTSTSTKKLSASTIPTKSKHVTLSHSNSKPERRATRTRIQPIEVPGLAVPDGALSAKSKAIRSAEHPSEKSDNPSKRVKAGPGRSSSGFMASTTSTLLTSDKGALKSVKPRRNRTRAAENMATPTPDVIIIDNAPEVILPSGHELLQASGLRKEDVEALDDFDEDMEDVAAVAAAVDPAEEPKTPDMPVTPLTTRIQRATEHLFPSRGSEPDVDAKLLKTSTIFGPLGLGVNDPHISQPASHCVSLNLDSSLSIPIDILDASNEVFSNFDTTSGAAPPGTFYNPNAGNGLLASVRASGASALVELASDASDEEKTHFAFFATRLHEGDLFVAFTGVQSWVFCSSSNTMASQRLNIPSHLLNESQKILVSKIEVVNYTGYADAAADADDRRWSQYLASISAF